MSRCFALSLTILCLVLTGCLKSAPSRVTAPPISSSAGPDAIKANDKNGDNALDGEELKTAPGLGYGTQPYSTEAKARFDANSDGKITADEITARVDKWIGSKIGLTQFSVTITLDGRPLEGATVKLVPETWLGTEIKPGTGTTDAGGRVNLSIAATDLKPNEAGLQGMRLGVYKVEVTHPTQKIPAKFNTATELGVEIANDDPNLGRATIPLTSS